MGKELFGRYLSLIEKADNILGYSIEELCLSDSGHHLDSTRYTQPALYIVNVLHYLALSESKKVVPDFLAGHSLGEYNALFAAGAVDFETGLRLVKKRGELMSEANNGKMAAIIGFGEEKIRDLIESEGLVHIDIANLNAPSQIVISGPATEIERAQFTFESAGCKLFLPLKVSGAFHSRLMAKAGRDFALFIEQFEFGEIGIPIISNITAREYSEQSIKRLLSDQITHPVKWTESMQYLMGKGVNDFIEVGPGKVLTKLIGHIRKAAPLQEVSEKKVVYSSQNSKTETPGKERHDAFPSAIDKQTNGRKLLFMYAGQGSQYCNMGKELYRNSRVFRNNMDECSRLFERTTGCSLNAVIYKESGRAQAFDDVLFTHPAIFALGYSLTQLLKNLGIYPDGLIGYSLGEYIAAVVAEAMTLQEGMEIVIHQAKNLQSKCSQGAMLAVMDHVALFNENEEVFKGTAFVGTNSADCFVVSGPESQIGAIQSWLNERTIISQIMPVKYAFHSEMVEPIKSEFLKLTDQIEFDRPRLPIYSCTTAGIVEAIDSQHLWNIIRAPIHFDVLISRLREQAQFTFIDSSATGTLANFVNCGTAKGEDLALQAMNQFGKNIEAISYLQSEVERRSSM